mgnify:FL=1
MPLSKVKAEEESPTEPFDQISGTETILLAEDEADIREPLKDVLERFGYKVIDAVDGEDAINKFIDNKDKIEFLIFNVMMPKKTGKEAYLEIRKIKPDIKALFMSGYPADVVHKEGILEEGLNFISKPVSPKALLRKVREVLDA